jgi:hypothetical protein
VSVAVGGLFSVEAFDKLVKHVVNECIVIAPCPGEISVSDTSDSGRQIGVRHTILESGVTGRISVKFTFRTSDTLTGTCFRLILGPYIYIYMFVHMHMSTNDVYMIICFR